MICRRFLGIFYPAAVYQKYNLELEQMEEHFFANFKVMSDPGYLRVADMNLARKNGVEETFEGHQDQDGKTKDETQNGEGGEAQNALSPKVDKTVLFQILVELEKNDILTLVDLNIKEGKASPPKRYTSGSMILAVENAGQLIEDEELRIQIRGSGMGTSATRVEILKKLFHIKCLNLGKKTQVITPSLLREMIYNVVDNSIRQLLNPDLAASWGKGLTYVSEGSITSEEYMEKLERLVTGRTASVIRMNNQHDLRRVFDSTAVFYKKTESNKKKTKL